MMFSGGPPEELRLRYAKNQQRKPALTLFSYIISSHRLL
jgi:hypothetical protein